jgi:hypothetical protein
MATNERRPNRHRARPFFVGPNRRDFEDLVSPAGRGAHQEEGCRETDTIDPDET